MSDVRGRPKPQNKAFAGPTVASNGTLTIVGAPVTSGQPLQGCDLGPTALRANGLVAGAQRLGWAVKDAGNVFPPRVEAQNAPPAGEAADLVAGQGHNAPGVEAQCAALADACEAAARRGEFVVTLGGDHSLAMGSITGIRRVRPDTVVVWVDAHGDCNTPKSSPSGNIHGMPVAGILGIFNGTPMEGAMPFLQTVEPMDKNALALIGLRDIDDVERTILYDQRIPSFSMIEVDRWGIGGCVTRLLNALDPTGRRPIHLSFDIDGCDPSVAPATGTVKRGGLSYREAHYICEAVSRTGRLASMDMVEVNPLLASKKRAEVRKGALNLDSHSTRDDILRESGVDIDGDETSAFAVELIMSALGQTILQDHSSYI